MSVTEVSRVSLLLLHTSNGRRCRRRRRYRRRLLCNTPQRAPDQLRAGINYIFLLIVH